MHVALALLAMSAAPLAAHPQPSTPEKQVSFEIRVAEIQGLGWRADFQQQLKPISTREGKSAWTIDQSALKSLLDECNDSTTAPKVTTWEGSHASVKTGKQWQMVTSVREVLDAPKGVVKSAAYQPKFTAVDNGDSVKASGRSLEQGMLVDVSWDVQQVLAVHTVTHKGTEIEGQGRRNASYQVPEIVKDTYKGEWLVPDDSALVLSMGPRTVAGPLNIAQIHERVLIVTARHVLTEDEESKIEIEPVHQTNFSNPPVTAPEPKAWMPTPPPPSRALPQAAGVDGSLPPLPDDTMHVTPESGDVDPKATPQMRVPEKQTGGAAPKAHPVEGNAGDSEKPVAAVGKPGSFVAHRAIPVGTPIVNLPTLRGENTTDQGPDCQELFQNRTYADLVTNMDEAPTGKLIFGTGVTMARGLTGRPIPLPAPRHDSEMVKAGLVEKMGSVMSIKLRVDSDALSRLQTETKVTRIPMAGNLALEITARVVPAPDVACDAAPECPIAK